MCFAWPSEPAYRPLSDDVAEVEPETVNALARLVNLEAGDAAAFAAAANWATGLNDTSGKRIVLAAFSLLGVISTAAMTDTQIDPSNLNVDVQILAISFAAFVMARGSYHLFFKTDAPATTPAPSNLQGSH
jgi:hypothetical protein